MLSFRLRAADAWPFTFNNLKEWREWIGWCFLSVAWQWYDGKIQVQDSHSSTVYPSKHEIHGLDLDQRVMRQPACTVQPKLQKTRSSEEHNKERLLTWRPLTMTGRSPVFRSRKHASSFGASLNLYMTQWRLWTREEPISLVRSTSTFPLPKRAFYLTQVIKDE